jgi:hypothetical protein
MPNDRETRRVRWTTIVEIVLDYRLELHSNNSLSNVGKNQREKQAKSIRVYRRTSQSIDTLTNKCRQKAMIGIRLCRFDNFL